MRRIHWGVILSVVTLAAVLLGADGLGGKAEPSRVATCNVRKIMLDYQRFVDLKNRTDADEKKATDELKKKTELVENMLKQLADLKKDSPDYARLDEACWQKTFEARSFQEVEKNRLERQRRDGLLECYRAILDEIAAYAKEAGLDVVYYTRDMRLEDAMTVQDVESLIGANAILYSDPKVDMSAAILARLNAKYQAGQAKEPLPPPPVPAPAPTPPPTK